MQLYHNIILQYYSFDKPWKFVRWKGKVENIICLVSPEWCNAVQTSGCTPCPWWMGPTRLVLHCSLHERIRLRYYTILFHTYREKRQNWHWLEHKLTSQSVVHGNVVSCWQQCNRADPAHPLWNQGRLECARECWSARCREWQFCRRSPSHQPSQWWTPLDCPRTSGEARQEEEEDMINTSILQWISIINQCLKACSTGARECVNNNDWLGHVHFSVRHALKAASPVHWQIETTRSNFAVKTNQLSNDIVLLFRRAEWKKKTAVAVAQYAHSISIPDFLLVFLLLLAFWAWEKREEKTKRNNDYLAFGRILSCRIHEDSSVLECSVHVGNLDRERERVNEWMNGEDSEQPDWENMDPARQSIKSSWRGWSLLLLCLLPITATIPLERADTFKCSVNTGNWLTRTS